MSLKAVVWFTIHNNRRNRFIALFAHLCKTIYRASQHPGYDVNCNGEKAVLAQSVPSNTLPLFFDVGANVGDWTAMAQDIFPKATIHSFELNPKTAEHLTRRFAGDEQIHVHPFGLADSSGNVEFYSYSGEASVLSGLRAPLHSHVPHTKESATIRTGDNTCKELGIIAIDFLKIDAEGADFEVISGFKNMLSNQQIQVIQFEHEGGHYLRDFYDLLTPMGYSIGKLYANYVDFTDHDAKLEHFLGPNYIAIPSSNKKLLQTLKTGWKVSSLPKTAP